MARKTWQDILTDSILHDAWHKVRRNNGASGGDNITIASFQIGAGQRINALRNALVNGRYRPGPLRSIAIPKKNGGTRVLNIPCVGDRVLQTAVNAILTPILDKEFSPLSFGYRPGRGVGNAISAISRFRKQGFRYTLEGDIARCFDEIPHSLLINKLSTHCDELKIIDLIELWLESYNPNGIGIPQGSPISPLLCNLHLDAIDETMEAQGIKFVRFADDFVALTKSRETAESGLVALTKVLREHGLEINPEKTAIREYDQTLGFLGHVFTRSMVWKSEFYDDSEPLLNEDAIDATPTEEEIAKYEAEINGETEIGELRLSAKQPLYVLEKGALLYARNFTFYVRSEEFDKEVPRFQIHGSRISRIEIGPGAKADWSALELCVAMNIEMALANGWGQALGIFAPLGNRRAKRMKAQVKFLADDSKRLSLAAKIAENRIANMATRLMKMNLKPKIEAIKGQVAIMRRISRRVRHEESLENIMGREGQASAIYWQNFKLFFDKDWKFDGRRRDPPPDPINAVIGYLAALLERDVKVALDRTGLLTNFGILHADHDYATPLVFDLMEAFRANLIEALAARMIGIRAISPRMFIVENFTDENGKRFKICKIEREAKKKIINSYEDWVKRTIEDPINGMKITWRDLIEKEAQNLAKFFDGESDDFTPFRADW